MTVFDFSGCGLSEGDYISLGYFEKDDTSLVIDYVKNNFFVSEIGIWGRSMGASAAIMTGAIRNDINFILADSPYVNMKKLCEEIG